MWLVRLIRPSTAVGISQERHVYVGTEEEMVGWHHRLNGHERRRTLGDGDGQGGRACYSPWGPKGGGHD